MGLSWGAIGGALKNTVLPAIALLGGPVAPLALAISEAISHAEHGEEDGHTKKQHVLDVARTSIQTLGIAQEDVSEELMYLLDDVTELDVKLRETYARIARVVELIKERKSA
jgi:hypothetical protein